MRIISNVSLFLKKWIEISVFKYSKTGCISPLLLNMIKNIYSSKNSMAQIVHETLSLKRQRKEKKEKQKSHRGISISRWNGLSPVRSSCFCARHKNWCVAFHRSSLILPYFFLFLLALNPHLSRIFNYNSMIWKAIIRWQNFTRFLVRNILIRIEIYIYMDWIQLYFKGKKFLILHEVWIIRYLKSQFSLSLFFLFPFDFNELADE